MEGSDYFFRLKLPVGRMSILTAPIKKMEHHVSLAHGGDHIQLTSPPCHGPTGEKHVLHVIAVISNFARFKRRYELYWKFKRQMDEHKNVILYTCEVALGDRPFMVTEPGNPRHLQLRTRDELWIKENMINLMVRRLPLGWTYMAWVDADVEFLNRDFANETIHQLQNHKIVQMFENVVNLGPDGEIVSTATSFMSQYIKKASGYPYRNKYAGTHWHPGFAHACTREAYDAMGGLIDYAILGAADHHMVLAWIGKVDDSYPPGLHPNYVKRLKQYEALCERTIRREVSYVKGTIIHEWHGRYKNRRYVERWSILQGNEFDPEVDIKYNSYGILVFATEKNKLRDEIREYFRQRNEDGVEND